MSFKKKGQSTDFLEPLTGAIKRKKFITIDIESKDGDSQKPGFTRPFLVGLYDPQEGEFQQFADEPHLKSRDWKRRHISPGGCLDKLLSVALTRKFHAHVFYAHNGGGFDHLFLLAWLREHLDEFGFEVIPVQSSIQVIRVWRLPEGPDDPIRERWEFLDSMKLIPMGLERACKTFGLPGKVDHDLAMEEDDPRWGVYLKQDCVALATVLTLFFDMVEHKLGGEIGMTAPSTSMKLFRRRFLGRDGTPSKIARFAHWPDCKTKNHATRPCEGCAHQWIRLGYYGGRTEMFKAYGERLHYYDINSSYVAAMQEDMPVGDRTVATTLDWRMAEKHGGFVECMVYVPPDCKVPPLPHRDVKTGKLLFPSGYFHGVWTTAELKLLDDPSVNGRIESVKRVVWFRKKPLFKFMVNELWRLRDKGEPDFDEGMSALAKLMGNSLYGKFGMRQERTSVVFAQDVDEGKCFLCRGPCEQVGGFCKECEGSKPAMSDIDGDVWYQHKQVDAAYIIPHIAAWITSLARIRIWGYMKDALDAGGELLYCDSVTGDRTTVVRGPLGVEVLTMEDLWERAGDKTSSRGKEFAALDSYQALTQSGWSPIERILRHRSGKTTHRITTKDGQTQVTSDHGIMVDGEQTTPSEFAAQRASFTRVTVPGAAPLERLDIMPHLAHWQHALVRKKPVGVQSYAFDVDEESVYLRSTWGEARGLAPLKIRRYYDRGSAELHALVRLVSTYACDGSASIVGMTTDTRFMLSFCKKRIDVVERVKRDLETIAPGVDVFGPHWTDTTFVVRSGTATMACFFAALCGVKSLGKRLPSFMFALDGEAFLEALQGLLEGDGPPDAAGQMCFTTISQRLAAGVSLMLGQHGQEHGFTFRPVKGSWFIRTRPEGSARKGRVIRQEAFESEPDGWVYDLTVPGPETFVDGIGQVLLHNTDSIITDIVLPSTTGLGGLKDEYPLTTAKKHDEAFAFESPEQATFWLDAMLLTGTFVQPKVYMLESHKFEQPKVTMKGFPYRRTDTGHEKACVCPECIIRCKENLIKLRAGESLSWRQLEKVRSLARDGFRNPPKMREVKKSFRSPYSKRKLAEDGTTTSVVLDERAFNFDGDAWRSAAE